MNGVRINDRAYQTDNLGFLVRAQDWTEDFAEATAAQVGLVEGLTDRHWMVIHYLRGRFEKTGRCPLLYFACSDNGLSVAELQSLFPTGYLRGACRLAGITYREGYLSNPCRAADDDDCPVERAEKVYRVDVRGFLVDPGEWDSAFARHRAEEMGLPDGLKQEHWRVLAHLRATQAETGEVPTVYALCESLSLTIEDLARLFPTGYHRGAVKLAGLRVR
ncbi:MAG: sulfurtransferase TusE [Deltaproteobacteria bacterium HGW-Deltaproteobacteria-20]|nr:MAG: sulfurtransferase TusE [Deltaproteobacteria bacterium HGW-Deltaproteobacteria-20]